MGSDRAFAIPRSYSLHRRAVAEKRWLLPTRWPLQKIRIGLSTSSGTNIGTAAYDPTRNLVYINNASDSSNTALNPPILHGLLAFTITSSCQLQFAWQQTVGPADTHDGPPASPTVANGVVYYVDGPATGCTSDCRRGSRAGIKGRACSRRQIADSVANVGWDGNGRRSSRSYCSKS